MQKKFVLFWAVVVILCAALGIMTRKSYEVPSFERAGDFKSAGDYLYKGSERHAPAFEQLIENSDLVIEGICLDKREIQHQTVLTDVKVTKVLKGKKDLLNNVIHVYEPSFFNFKTKLYFSRSGYNLMVSGKKYVLFLKKKEYAPGYRENEFEKKCYVIAPVDISLEAYSKFEASENYQREPAPTGENLTYKDIANFEVLAADKETLDEYNKLKREVLNMLKNSR